MTGQRSWLGYILAGLIGIAGGIAGSYVAVLLGLLSAESQLSVSADSYSDQGAKSTDIQLTAPVNAEDFIRAASIARPAVVHIRVVTEETSYMPIIDPFWGDFWGFRPYKRFSRRYGSGVIITSDGYIVTNYHVVGAEGELEVTLWDKRKYKARRIGYDPSTDIAVIKIDAENLPYLEFGNSDALRVGEWVLAVGNPFNLESTVTAGIVSARGRNLNIISGKFALRSFIQTDAAVNPGNSGGALVNLRGELVGINIAIATPTGVYAGYSFAVPGNIVRKVAFDIINYGKVRRAYLGVVFRDATGEELKERGIEGRAGAYIESVIEGSPADKAGLKPGDIVVGINGIPLETASQLQEEVAQMDPGDVMALDVITENGTEKTVKAVLEELTEEAKNNPAWTGTEKVSLEEVLGIQVEPLAEREKRRLGIKSGVRVTHVVRGGPVDRYTGIKPGFVITEVNNQPVNNYKEVLDAVMKGGGNVTIKGFYPGSSQVFYYGFPLE